MEYLDIINALVLLSNFVLLPAITYGSQLALAALGVTLIYAVLRFSNFAHGDLMSFGTMATILITWWLQSMGITGGIMPTALIALPLGILITALLCILIDQSVYKFYRKQNGSIFHDR